MAKPSEADVARAVERVMRRDGWAIYREVRAGYGDARADLVGERGGACWVCECKTRLSLDLIDQAHGWVGRAERVCVAVPQAKRYRSRPTVVLRHFGIGLLSCRHLQSDYPDATFSLYPRWRRLANGASLGPVRDYLHPEQMVAGEAGTNRGGYHTAFRWTMKECAAFIASHPGATIKEVVEGVEHHYSRDSGARQGIVFAINNGLLKGVRIDASRKPWRLYPEERLTAALEKREEK